MKSQRHDSGECGRVVAKVYGVASVSLLAVGAGSAAGISGHLSFNLAWFASTMASLVVLSATRDSNAWVAPRAAALALLSLGMGVCMGAHVGQAAHHFGLCASISEDVCRTAQYILLGASMLAGGLVYGIFAIAGLLIPDTSPEVRWAKVIASGLLSVCMLSSLGVMFGFVSSKMQLEFFFMQVGLVSSCMSTFVQNSRLAKDARNGHADVLSLSAGVVIDYVCVGARVAYHVARVFGPVIVEIAKAMHEVEENKKKKKKN